jgi:uncharacterized membrane protein YeaQ/YmgE (transglycosylase-associated protein family)
MMTLLLLLAIGLAVPVLARAVVSPLRKQSLTVHLLLGGVGALLAGLLARSMRGPDTPFYVAAVIVPVVGALLALLLNPGRAAPAGHAAPALARVSAGAPSDGGKAPSDHTSQVGGSNDIFRY